MLAKRQLNIAISLEILLLNSYEKERERQIDDIWSPTGRFPNSELCELQSSIFEMSGFFMFG